MARVGGGHSHVPPDGVWWVGSPDGVESRFGWVLPGCGIAVRPLPRLIHRRRFTVLCWSRDGAAPAPLACGRRFRGAGPLRGGCRWRCRPYRFHLLAFAFSRLAFRPASAESQCDKEPGQETALALLDLRCFIGPPTDGSRLPSQQLRGGAWDPRVLAEHARHLGWLLPPASPRAMPPFYRYSGHSMPKAETAPVYDQAPSLLVPSIPQQPTTPSRRHGRPLTQLPPRLGNWPSGLRAGTPDRRGKRGEVAAIFAMITTNPTRSIGDVGLGITSSSRPPS